MALMSSGSRWHLARARPALDARRETRLLSQFRYASMRTGAVCARRRQNRQASQVDQQQPPNGPDDRPRPRGTAFQYAGMGMELAAAIIGLTLAGLWFDQHFGTGRVGLTVGAVVGIVGGLYNFIRRAIELGRTDASRSRPGRHEQVHDQERRD